MWLSTEEFYRKTSKGRYHLYIEYGKKLTGTQHHPRAKIFGHFDIIKRNRNDQERHYFDSSESKILKELQRIEGLMRKKKYGHIAIKDKHCGHGTLTH